jgi:hypothetical protein
MAEGRIEYVNGSIGFLSAGFQTPETHRLRRCLYIYIFYYGMRRSIKLRTSSKLS